MKALRVVGVALLVMGFTLVAQAAEPQAKPSPLLCGASSTAAPSAELPQFLNKPNAKALASAGFIVHVCWVTCDFCHDDSDCYLNGDFVGPCEAGFFCQ